MKVLCEMPNSNLNGRKRYRLKMFANVIELLNFVCGYHVPAWIVVR